MRRTPPLCAGAVGVVGTVAWMTAGLLGAHAASSRHATTVVARINATGFAVGTAECCAQDAVLTRQYSQSDSQHFASRNRLPVSATLASVTGYRAWDDVAEHFGELLRDHRRAA